MNCPALPVKLCRKCGESFAGARCKPCWAKYMRSWNVANPDKVKANAFRKHERNRETDNLRNKLWRERNPEKVDAYWRAFHAANKHKEVEWNRRKRIKNRAKNSDTQRRYHEARPGLKNLWDANRRAIAKQATPGWANKFFIAEAFHLAKLREQICGGNWHVDHIVPLQSDKVCGLHVENNLQVIPARHNLTKSNVYWPHMPS